MKKILYHGSDVILKEPMFGIGKEDNDYGSGFYTTEDIEKAREWAWINGSPKSAVCNQYELDMSGLDVMNLDDYGTLAWLAEVICHRGTQTEITAEMGELLVEKYKINTSEADVIIGYRADDSYISVVESFLNNQLSVDEVDRMFRKGNLGQQVFIKSQKAFDSLVFTGYEEVNPVIAGKYGDADTCARREVHKFLTGRMRAIQIEGFSPFGITAREAVKEDFYYDKDYCCYLPVEEQNNQITKKGKNNYEMEF